MSALRRLISLGDPDALDRAAVGAKAANLATALRAGFPVLPGYVVPTAFGLPARVAGVEALARGDTARARIAARGVVLDERLSAALAALPDVAPFVVRSSSILDDDGRWAGAFASFGDVRREELGTTVRGCWASAFSPDVLGRARAVGVEPGAIGLAVLIQPQVEPELGGWARAHGDRVEVVAVRGSPATLLSGGPAAIRVFVDPLGRVDGQALSGPELLVVQTIAVLSRRATTVVGLPYLEWAWSDGAAVVFQLSRDGGPARGGGEADPPAGRLATPGIALPAYRRFAALMLTRRGPLANRLIAPWAAAAPEDLAVGAVEGEPRALLDLASELGEGLERSVTGALGLSSARLVTRIARGDRQLAERFGELRIDEDAAGRLLGSVEALGRLLVLSGRLEHPRDIWHQDASWLAACLDDAPRRPQPQPQPRRRVDGFDDVIAAVIAGSGVQSRGLAASPGRAAGPLCFLAGPDLPDAHARPQPGDIIVVDQPIPAFAPFLWGAAGLVARDGAPAAHLCEVARSIHLPAVVGIGRNAGWPGSGRVAVLVDGNAGEVAFAAL